MRSSSLYKELKLSKIKRNFKIVWLNFKEMNYNLELATIEVSLHLIGIILKFYCSLFHLETPPTLL